MRDRNLRGRRRGLNPTKVVFVYVAAFFLVCFHQADRLADWFDDLALGSDGLGSEVAFQASAFLRDRVRPLGPGRMNAAEDRLLARIPVGGLLGHWLEPEPTSTYQADTLMPPPPEAGRESGAGVGADGSNLPYWAQEAPPAADPAEQARLAALSGWADPARPARVFNPSRVLLLGDSMMLEGLGPPLQRELKKHPGLVVNREGEYGTGLTRLDNFDWLAYFEEMLLKYRPDLIIMTLGGNDQQDMIRPGQRRIFLGSDEWNRTYADRLKDLLHRAEVKGVGIFWVGLPVMGQEPYNSRAAQLNTLAQEACQAAPNCRFWDAWLAVADEEGRYATYLPDAQGKSVRVRGRDQIHLTEVGGQIMAEKFLAATRSWVDFEQKTQEARAALPPSPAPEAAGPTAAPAPGPEAPTEGPIEGPTGTGSQATRPPTDDSDPARPETPPPGLEDDFDDLEILEELPGGILAPLPAPGPLTLAPAAGEADEGLDSNPRAEVREYSFFSALRGRTTAYYLARPLPTPARPGPFPVVFLLHGAWDDHRAWVEQMGAPALAALADGFGLILVMPDGEPFGWYVDGRETAIESYLIDELLPRVFQTQPLADAGRVGLCGLSMGGHGALTLALKHPGLFKAIGAMSAVTDLTAHAGGGHPLDRQLGLTEALGPAGPRGLDWLGFSALGLTRSRPESFLGRPLILSVGRDDKLTLAENRAYHRLLTDLNLEHVYQESPGGHDWNFWSAQLPIQLSFMADHL